MNTHQDNVSFWNRFLFNFWHSPGVKGGESDAASMQPRVERQPLGLMIGGVAVIMALVLSLLAYLSIQRSEQAMARLLAEKGASLLRVFESALRTGMRGYEGVPLQALMEEMAQSPDIMFVAVTMPDGVILAHSQRSRLGEVLRMQGRDITRERLEALAPEEDEKWQIISMEGQRVFMLYRHFTLGNKDWEKDVPEPTIFLGMDVSPFEITSGQNRTYIVMLCIVAMLVVLASLLALSYAQRAAESRRRQISAEGEVFRLEQEVRRQEKLAAVGTLAAGVAHEIRNPLSSIKGYATYFRQKFPAGSEDREAASVMVNEVNRLNRVISDLLGLSRPGDANLRPVCLENVVAHVLRLLRQNMAEKNITITCRMARVVPDAMADMERMGQALLNLCLNGIEAMPEGGNLTIAVSGGKKKVCLLVRDNGCGIPRETLGKIFDPYFTTKGSGTGLGLPAVHKIVRAHHGAIDVISHPAANGRAGGETVFRIWLNVAPPK